MPTCKNYINRISRANGIDYSSDEQVRLRERRARGRDEFAIVKDTSATVLVDADIRRIDEVEEVLKFTGCSKVEYLIDAHEHFDRTQKGTKLMKGTVN
jgi:hypothetical protein